MKTFLKLALALFSLYLAACQKPDSNTLTVGTIAGPEASLVEVAKEVAEKKYGLIIKIVEFNDYNLPNVALQDGSLDVNVYQHLPFLNAAKQMHGYQLEAISKTFIYPTGIYSKKIKNLNQLPEEALIAIPNDPSNETRALLLLQQAGLIVLKKTNHLLTVKDISSNPKHLEIKELDAAQLPRILTDVDAAVINTNFAVAAGLRLNRDTLYREDKNSPYANLIVIRTDNPKKEQLEQFVQAMHSKEVLKKAHELFGDAAIPAW